MSRFTGRQYRGASRDLRTVKREEAEARQAAYEAAGRPTGWMHPFRAGRKMREGEL
jgi:hypothetical protein